MEKEQQEKMIVQCPRCSKRLRVPGDRNVLATCPNCDFKFETWNNWMYSQQPYQAQQNQQDSNQQYQAQHNQHFNQQSYQSQMPTGTKKLIKIFFALIAMLLFLCIISPVGHIMIKILPELLAVCIGRMLVVCTISYPILLLILIPIKSKIGMLHIVGLLFSYAYSSIIMLIPAMFSRDCFKMLQDSPLTYDFIFGFIGCSVAMYILKTSNKS